MWHAEPAEKQLCREGPGDLAHAKLNMSEQHALAASQQLTGKNIESRLKEVILSLLGTSEIYH